MEHMKGTRSRWSMQATLLRLGHINQPRMPPLPSFDILFQKVNQSSYSLSLLYHSLYQAHIHSFNPSFVLSIQTSRQDEVHIHRRRVPRPRHRTIHRGPTLLRSLMRSHRSYRHWMFSHRFRMQLWQGGYPNALGHALCAEGVQPRRSSEGDFDA